MALLLVSAATTLSARTPAPLDTPTIQIITPADGVNLPAYTGEGDEGDADDLAGYKERKDKPNGASPGVVIQARMAYEVWRMHFFFVLGLYR